VNDSRLEAIEIKLAHLERALTEISDVVARQDQSLLRLQAQNQQLKNQLAAMGEADSNAASAVEIPPHY
jgi:uncharacterized coiled-coil protein SlyX